MWCTTTQRRTLWITLAAFACALVLSMAHAGEHGAVEHEHDEHTCVIGLWDDDVEHSSVSDHTASAVATERSLYLPSLRESHRCGGTRAPKPPPTGPPTH